MWQGNFTEQEIRDMSPAEWAQHREAIRGRVDREMKSFYTHELPKTPLTYHCGTCNVQWTVPVKVIQGVSPMEVEPIFCAVCEKKSAYIVQLDLFDSF